MMVPHVQQALQSPSLELDDNTTLVAGMDDKAPANDAELKRIHHKKHQNSQSGVWTTCQKPVEYITKISYKFPNYGIQKKTF